MTEVEIPVPGVQPLDHTADVGIEVRAPDLRELCLRAASGMTYLILDAPPPEVTEERRVRVEGSSPAHLLRNWLREVLYLFDGEGLVFAAGRIEELGDGNLEGIVDAGFPSGPPAREIKGVTLHGLEAREMQTEGWYARVIFDV